jgi:hypothetical protein
MDARERGLSLSRVRFDVLATLVFRGETEVPTVEGTRSHERKLIEGLRRTWSEVRSGKVVNWR